MFIIVGHHHNQGYEDASCDDCVVRVLGAFHTQAQADACIRAYVAEHARYRKWAELDAYIKERAWERRNMKPDRPPEPTPAWDGSLFAGDFDADDLSTHEVATE